MAPHDEVIAAGIPAKATARCLADPGKAYAIYIKGGTGATLTLKLPAGEYNAEWIDPHTGAVTRTLPSGAVRGTWEVASPEYREDIALRIRRTRP